MTDPTPSLIQQRMALQRQVSWATYQIIFSVVIVLSWALILVLDGPDPVRVIGIVVFVAGAVIGYLKRRAGQRDIRVFENEHGVDAGVQKPVG